jgi:hypothetical protein
MRHLLLCLSKNNLVTDQKNLIRHFEIKKHKNMGISKILLTPAFSLRVIAVMPEKIVTDQITRLSTYFKNRVI